MPRTPGTWSAETARAMVVRRRELRAQRQANAAAVDVAPAGPTSPATPAAYQGQTLTRTRAHVATLQTKLEAHLRGSALDGALVRDLCRAIKDLAELERILDGRPAPGTLRPSTAAPRPAARVPLQPLSQGEAIEPPGLTERPEW